MKMNFLKNLFIYLCLSIILFSCEDFLDSKSNSNFTESTVFSNIDFAQKVVNGAYNIFASYDLDVFYTFMGADNDVEVNWEFDSDGLYALCHYITNPGNGGGGGVWNLLFQAIERCNIAIDNLPESPIWNGEDADEARRIYAEAVTLRALSYYILISFFGDVPFLTKSTQDGDNFYVPKTDRDEIYEFIVKDLGECIEYLPWMTVTGTAETINKGFAKGLRARIALQYAGFSMRNRTFETRRGRNWEEYYRIANQECKEIIESGQHSLNPSYLQIWKTIHAYSQDVAYKEVLFELAYGRGQTGRVAQTLGMWFCTNPAEPKYGRAACDGGVHPSYYYTFDRNDIRRNINVELYHYGDRNYLSQQRPIHYSG